MKGTVLIVDDDRALCELAAEALGAAGFDVTWTTDPASVPDRMTASCADVVVTDLRMGVTDGLRICEAVADGWPGVPVIVITAFGSLDAAVGAIRAGAYDFLTKPFELEALVLAVERATRHRAMGQEIRRLRCEVDDAEGFGDLVGNSDGMRRVYDLVERASRTNASVLVTGETGTGKELVARALDRSGRCGPGPFVTVDCGAMPDGVVESELFGHVRGAFTDARASRTGLCLRADGGTLFLDEIGELPLAVQPKLLRALQERVVRPVGSDVEIAFDARVVAATHRNLEVLVREGRFREDLFFRLGTIHVALPPLRMRGDDVLLLARRFLARLAAQLDGRSLELSPVATALLSAYQWPGNVRELQHAMERAAAMARTRVIEPEDLPERIRDAAGSNRQETEPSAPLASLEVVEQRHVLAVLRVCDGNKTMAAQVLGIDRKTLQRKLSRLRRGEADRNRGGVSPHPG